MDEPIKEGGYGILILVYSYIYAYEFHNICLEHLYFIIWFINESKGTY